MASPGGTDNGVPLLVLTAAVTAPPPAPQKRARAHARDSHRRPLASRIRSRRQQSGQSVPGVEGAAEDARRRGAIEFDPARTTRTLFETFDGLQVVAETTAIDGKYWTRFSASASAGSQAGGEADAINEATKGWVFRVADYRGGNQKLIGWFMGQIMKASGGKANPQMVNQLLREKLDAGD